MNRSEGVFLDTSGWIAMLDDDDRLHVEAMARLDQIGVEGRTLFTTDWVLAETGNGLARVKVRRRFAGAVKTFSASPVARLIRVDGDLFQEALDLYDQTADKSWGLVDCASFVVMRREHILDAFTADRHFEQAGFRRLLTPRPR
ncbi:MAG: type II toxin-antitoxin system VapC family toxin [Pirellulales bacterium]|nr:type II toxin-antitoxin system VapC family toxin [Pirellulales bacterium]